jgi:KEOPS complex subunit Cgi121
MASERIVFNQLIKEIKEIAPQSTIQIMNGERIIGYDHVFFAVLNALSAKRNQRNICDDLSLEILVYASAQRQITHAVEILGVKEDTQQLVLVAISEDKRELDRLRERISQIKGLKSDDSFLESQNPERIDRLKETFKITNSEFESVRLKGRKNNEILERLVIEKMALLAVSV